jgi:predicted anti-sigma-YlaC factor YlaD
MTTNCEAFENLLPSYVDGDLPDEERRRVDAHVRECASCREALSFYRELEASLVARRDLRPAPQPFAVKIARHLAPGPARGVLSVLVGLPGLLSAAFILVGVVLLVYMDAVVRFFDRFGGEFSIGLSPLGEEWIHEATRFTGGEYTLLAVFAGVFAVIMLTGSWMVLRFVRE